MGVSSWYTIAMKFLENIKKVHCVGIGGIGMSALAKFLRHHGILVTGSDLVPSSVTDDLRNNYNIDVCIGSNEGHVTAEHDMLIYSPAVPSTNGERMAALDFGIQKFSYPEVLGQISREMKTIAISGTNGKTTTSTMLVELLKHLGVDPTAIIGEYLQKYNSNFVAGQSEYFVTEACEYKDSFLNIHHDILVITNITEDHLDYFKNLQGIQQSFTELVHNKKETGTLVCNKGLKELKPIIEEAQKLGYSIIDYGEYIESTQLSIPGNHNIYNAAAALGVIKALGLSFKEAQEYLHKSFQGAKRRMEHVGFTEHGALIFDDYAHNPEGLEHLIQGLREYYPTKKIVMLFEPHLYSRTNDFKESFGKILSTVDALYLFPVYKAREVHRPEEDFLLERFIKKDKLIFNKVLDKEVFISEFTSKKYGTDSIIVTAGAGDIWKIGLNLKK